MQKFFFLLYTATLILLVPNIRVMADNPAYHKALKNIEVYAHRGARSFSPENTIPSYRTALAVGVDWIDMDVVITKDGIIVVYHDLWLNPDVLSKNGKFWAKDNTEFYKDLENRPGGIDKNIQPYLIKNLKYAQLQQYDAGRINPDSPYAKNFPDQHPVYNTPIPTLQQVVVYADKVSHKMVKYQIEMKNDPTKPDWTVSPKEFAAKLNAFIVENNILNRVEVQAFDWEILYELHKVNPNIKLAFLVSSDGIERMKSSDQKQAGMWSGGKLLKDYGYSLPKMVKELGGDCYEPEDIALTKEDLDEAHRLGLKVVVWGCARNLDAKLIEWQVDGIITDDPARLNSMLAARGIPVPSNVYDNVKKICTS